MADQEDKDNAYTQLKEEKGHRVQRGCMVTFLSWFMAIAFLYLSKPISKSLDADLSWLELLSWALLIFICPVFGILYGMDLKEHLDWQAKRSGSSIWFRFLILLGCWLLAAVVGSMGIVFIMAAIHPNDPQNYWLNQVLTGGISLPFFALTWWLLKLPFRDFRAETIAQQEAVQKRLNERLTNPDFLGIEAAGEMHLPFEFKIMFRPDSEWQTKDWMLYPLGQNNNTEQHMILGLEPADTESLWRCKHDQAQAPELYLRFATDEDSYYLLKLESGNDDPAVYKSQEGESYCLFGDELPDSKPEKIADHFSQFISWPKEAI